MDRYDEAIEDFNVVLARDKNNAVAYSLRAAAKFYLGRYDESIEDYNDALLRDKNDAAAYFLRATAKYESGDKAGARSDFETAQGLDPERFPFPAERFKEDKK